MPAYTSVPLTPLYDAGILMGIQFRGKQLQVHSIVPIQKLRMWATPSFSDIGMADKLRKGVISRAAELGRLNRRKRQKKLREEREEGERAAIKEIKLLQNELYKMTIEHLNKQIDLFEEVQKATEKGASSASFTLHITEEIISNSLQLIYEASKCDFPITKHVFREFLLFDEVIKRYLIDQGAKYIEQWNNYVIPDFYCKHCFQSDEPDSRTKDCSLWTECIQTGKKPDRIRESEGGCGPVHNPREVYNSRGNRRRLDVWQKFYFIRNVQDLQEGYAYRSGYSSVDDWKPGPWLEWLFDGNGKAHHSELFGNMAKSRIDICFSF